ncbi:hypothetical protein LL912_21155 [Niabella sp. CC-SYL272]|uniref:hypothetical protein n=1 Tax=Niabella agricola TaxID=2891571 RepID=UPI001F33B089|nr:hypothetical protein [Niabella agricola]MCF3111309.1 hypothetical protein [Niabella agricola]
MKSIFLIVGCMIWAACGRKTTTVNDSGTGGSTGVPVSLFTDANFETGLYLKGDVSGAPSAGMSLYPFGQKGNKPAWELAEWASKYLLQQNGMVEKNGEKLYENNGKLLSFMREGNTTKIRMDVKASAEYEHPRKSGEAWPHLLLEQAFSVKPYLKHVDKLILNFEGRLVNCRLAMPQGSFDAGLHTAQFQLFITLQNLNPQSSSYGELVWFGVPFYDYRHRQLQVYAAQDIGKGDATGMFIYSLGTTDYMQGSFHDANWVKVEKDLKPLMVKAVNLAKERGYLKGATLDDIRIGGMNIGWEVPGTFDAGFEFRGFDLKYLPLKEGSAGK